MEPEPMTSLRINGYDLDLMERGGSLVWEVSRYETPPKNLTKSGRRKPYTSAYGDVRTVKFTSPWTHHAINWAVAATNCTDEADRKYILHQLTYPGQPYQPESD